MKRCAFHISICVGGSLALAALLFAGCAAPVGADRVSTRQAYKQIEANALRSSKLSATTITIVHRYGMDKLATHEPEEAVRQLHAKALAIGDRDLLFALAELSYAAGDRVPCNMKPREKRDPRDYYLASALYAWLFLFGDEKEAPPTAFDRRFRDACDFYNYSLGLAFMKAMDTNGIVELRESNRRLPTGKIDIRVTQSALPVRLEMFDRILLADQYRIHGLSVRNREPGLGAPLICVKPVDPHSAGLRLSSPATMILRGPTSLAKLASGQSVGSLEVYSGFNAPDITVGSTRVPLETDLTTYRAYTLNQSHIWKLGRLQFLAPAERIKSQLLLSQPYDPARIPVVFVHGTFSSPVTWAEMANSLVADPVLRERYQIWSFMYGSGNPLVTSIAEFRAALVDKVKQLDPAGTNAALRQMVVIGHSQGGLLTKSVAIKTDDKIWRLVSTNRLEDLKISEEQRANLRRLLFVEPLPFVKRVVFIATPHRGSYLSTSLARRLGASLVSLPRRLVTRSTDVLRITEGSEHGRFLNGRLPTSLDGMSPKNPALLAMADIPVSPPIKANSIIPVKGNGDYHEGRDGLVTYQSAHVDYAESEFIVRSVHSCQNNPATIEEVRRILHEHLGEAPPRTLTDAPVNGRSTETSMKSP
jgi:pimeloyl-ACP methyl ester carboxylesterase